MDPPWRIKGGQQNDSQFMFSNSKFSLEYDTMSNQEIMDLKIESLSRNGFLFLWILNTQMNIAYETMNKWGYEVVDQIVWVKLKDNKINLTHGYYFMHSFEICLIGFKSESGQYPLRYLSSISSNVIFSDIRKKSQKPDIIYEIIETMLPGSKKIEVFARNHNLRSGWFSLGNQLGEVYDKWFNLLNCNECGCLIKLGLKRFKSKVQPNYDICEGCFSQIEQKDSFFWMNNNIEEEIFHHYHKCNNCEAEPIWGTRFTCKQCENYDLCEK